MLTQGANVLVSRDELLREVVKGCALATRGEPFDAFTIQSRDVGGEKLKKKMNVALRQRYSAATLKVIGIVRRSRRAIRGAGALRDVIGLCGRIPALWRQSVVEGPT